MSILATRSLLESCILAALEAGVVILDVYRSDFHVDYKNDHSPLTEADRRSHRVIADTLGPIGFPLISEESETLAADKRRHWQRLWMVDPLDGTREFVGRNGDFTVNIALIQERRPVLGVVFAPAAGVMYFGAEDFPSCRAKIEPEDHRSPDARRIMDSAALLPLEPPVTERPELTVVGSRSHMDPDTRAFLRDLEAEHGALRTLSRGSSLKFGLVAEGTAQIYPRMAPTMEWDTAAGHAVARFAGGSVCSLDGRELVYNKADLHNPAFVARGAGWKGASG
jgi:3'(2'), 5'-bisphosphate nucleotidase